MTKVHGKRYAYKFDFNGIYQTLQMNAKPPSNQPSLFYRFVGNNSTIT